MCCKHDKIFDKNGNDTGKKGYVLRTDKDALPYGRYTVRESGVAEGYLHDSTSRAWSKTVTIGRGDGHINTDHYEPGAASPNQYATIALNADDLVNLSNGNQVQRTDLHFIKKDEDSMERMGNIAWKLTSKTTGETHFFVNDDNGEFHSKSCDAKFNDNGTSTTGCRTRNNTVNNNDPDSPNSNGAIVKDDKGNYVVKDAKKLDNASGIWFTGIGPKSKDKDGTSVKWKSATVYTVTDAAGVSRLSNGNQVQRTDLHFIKKDEDSMERMGNIAWKLTSKTTGETHFFVNDDNGEFHSKSCDAKFNDNGTSTTGCRTRNNTVNNNDPDSPNSNGAIVKDDKGNYVVKDAKKLDNASGIWFTGIGPKSKDKDGTSVKWKSATVYTVTDAAGVSRDVTVPNNLRALPYDTYELTELKTPGANDDHKMVSVTFKAHEFTKNPDGSINHDGHGIDFDYGTIDNKLQGMATRLAYMGKGADGVNIDGEAGDKVAPATKDVVLTDVIDYWGVTRGSYNLDAQLYVVENGEMNIDGEAGDKVAPATKDVVLTDVIDYWGVTRGSYNLDAQLYVVENGEIVGEPVTTGHKQITIKNPITGRVAMQFEKFDASKYAGKTLVAFETMTNDKGEVITEHKDAKDTDQWIKIPLIHTNAQGDIDDESNAERPEGQPIKITDTVTYKNLEVGKTYTMTAELHERDENGKDKGIVKERSPIRLRTRTWKSARPIR